MTGQERLKITGPVGNVGPVEGGKIGLVGPSLIIPPATLSSSATVSSCFSIFRSPVCPRSETIPAIYDDGGYAIGRASTVMRVTLEKARLRRGRPTRAQEEGASKPAPTGCLHG